MHWAAISGHTNVVKLLLEKGASVTAVTTTNMNALHGACEGGRVETVAAIMEFVTTDEATKTAITTGKNEEGKTAWDIAVASKNAILCQTLKDKGDVNALSATCIIC